MASIPKTLGACADKLYQLKEQRLKIEAQVTKMKEEEKTLKEHLILHLSKEKAEGVKGRLASASISRSVVATAKDWPAVYAYILKNKDFSLLQKRLHDGACRERWEDGKVIPGVEPFNVLKVSLTKV